MSRPDELDIRELLRGEVGDPDGWEFLRDEVRELAALETEPIRREQDRSAEPAPERIGSYRVLEVLGQGGMGRVYKAHDPQLDRLLAIKVLGPGGDIARFEHEARAIAALNHPHILKVYGFGTHEGLTYIATDYIEGQDLAHVLAREKRLEPRRAAELALRIAEAIGHAHAHGIVHRDLKPANVLIDTSGEPRVVDFGLALSIGDERMTRTGRVVGTPYYMAPEQIAAGTIDARTDVYALGVMLYRMLAGELPFADSQNDRDRLYARVLQGQPARLRGQRPEVDCDLEAIVFKALDLEPHRRYGDAQQMARDLSRYQAGAAVEARRLGPLQRAWRLYRANRRTAHLLGLLAASLLAFLLQTLVMQNRRARLADQYRQQRDRALQAHNHAQQARAEAERQRERAQRHLADFESMADLKLGAELEQRLVGLGPQSWKIEGIRAWLADARGMLGRLPSHRAVIERLDRKAQGGKRLSRPEAWQRDLVRRMIPRVEAVCRRIDQVARWEAEAGSWRQRTVVAQAPTWRAAIRAIRASPRYGGLALAPQEGLVPLREDPHSRLWEFAHLPSGLPPRLGADGKWRITASTGVVLVLLPAGLFRMGALKGKPGPNRDPFAMLSESPVHEVRLAAFFLSKFELTQGQWLRLAGNNPSLWAARRFAGSALSLVHPVEQVTWNDCRQVLGRAGLSLPSEAQWEYGARAGTSSVWWTGNERGGLADAANLRDQAGRRHNAHHALKLTMTYERWDDGHVLTAPVGSYRANAFGLHDTLGNVREWCADAFVLEAYRKPLAPDGSGRRLLEQSDLLRVIRGGGFVCLADGARSAARHSHSAAKHTGFLGVRPARLVR